ncbi:MAG: YlmH/Sll1252 family protein [Eubacteriales bacterium]|nr:YlmH/Sll1252 family protein [Eubacteriales bacterium]MDD3881207.1 YlmH/Sll1252 family protein [Eubacteriales bacterium]MDD4511589.1 YlmH/Sll1252 family protein [Eubacteriales bacterium]
MRNTDEGREYYLSMAARAKNRPAPVFSRFLNLAQQKEAEAAMKGAGCFYKLFGGAEGCERRILGVCDEREIEESEFPLSCVCAKPRNARFAGRLEHRDALGSLMGLGIERDVTGDIIIRDGAAYVFCIKNMADYICGSLTKIGNTDVSAEAAAMPEGEMRKTRDVRLQVASPRVDAVIAHLYHLSRGDAQALSRTGKVMVDDSECLRPDYTLKEGQVISVRGYGRALYIGVEGQTKKGKSSLLIKAYS